MVLQVIKISATIHLHQTLAYANYNFNNNPVTIVYPLVLPNPDVQWEQVEQSNIGLDATILNNRVNLTVDAYLRNTSKMLVPAVVPVTTGYSSTNVPSVNAGSLENKGIEIGALNKKFSRCIYMEY